MQKTPRAPAYSHPGPGTLGEMGGHKDYTGLKVGRQILVSKDFLAEHQKSSKVHTCLSEKSAVKILVQNEPSNHLLWLHHGP